MNLLKTGLIVTLILVGSASAVFAGEIAIEKAWSRAMLPGAPAGAGFMIIRNAAEEDDRLVAASSPASGRVEIHTMEMDNGVMKMRALENGLDVPAQGSVELKPGGYHLMMMMVSEPFKEGDMVPVTLTFEKAGEIETKLMVMPAGAKQMHHN